MSSIRKLSLDTINRIAAGEVVQQPGSALKELIENSLDAKSTSINIELRDGGMTLLQISDNGTGIHVSDYPILCHRFTTSKVQEYEDLLKLNTFGFRGEALSSLSLVSKITVISRKNGESLAYKADFEQGEMVGPAQPFAFNRGTKIIAKDLFYNDICRKKSLNNFNQLFQVCLDVTFKYSLHYSTVAFSLKNENPVFATNGKTSKFNIIKAFLKSNIDEREFLEIPQTQSPNWAIEGLVSNCQFTAKTKELVLFINGRLVEAPELKSLLTDVYSRYLFKSTTYFVYLAISVNPKDIDVNVHPCKQIVKFNNRVEIFEEIKQILSELLGQNNSTKVIKFKQVEVNQTEIKKPAPSSMVRETPSVPLEWFIEQKPIQQLKESVEDLESVSLLKEGIVAGDAQDIIDNCVFIGCINKENSLIQYQNELYLVDVPRILMCVVYQNILENFSKLPSFKIPDSDLSLCRLFSLALDNPQLYDASTDPPKPILIEKMTKLLNSKAEMLQDYFSISIQDGVLCEIPVLVNQFLLPDINNLPEFVLRLASEVNWKKEIECLHKICEIVAWFYSKVPDKWKVSDNFYDFEYHYRNILIPYLRGRVQADPRYLGLNNGLYKIVSTVELYSIFERC